MTKHAPDISSLLDTLRAKNSHTHADELPQQLRPSVGAPERVPTLEKEHTTAISPMIRSRFLFADSWQNACFGQTWVSIAEMERVWTDSAIQKQIALRRQYWEQSVVARHAPSRISLFGIDRADFEETYLLWPLQPSAEPEVFLYTSAEERRFSDIAGLLSFLTA